MITLFKKIRHYFYHKKQDKKMWEEEVKRNNLRA